MLQNKKDILNNKYIPIITIVAECKKADTGVGPGVFGQFKQKSGVTKRTFFYFNFTFIK